MVLPVPNLDDRRFQDLVDDAKRLVQQRCPEWTNHNVSDPGVTLMELVGLRMLPPTPARVPVTFWLSAPAITDLTVAAGTRVGTVRTEATPSIEFATMADLVI